ncbi:hypothetical protein K435DRAFT_849161 [Dendrothele bispora CBS 962.96]|uniref:Uncharacterized protein n=1 Tax=Dendrothele bispora (strain CBS 962.96) TaxID=1314807 RepID=A0A4V4HIE9_DENBC|nr:hypothetical protein K435DRAFT_870183 [Dendrothele bispora CBS 962.96]THV06366.1 hypothetical protein K435DRAFT_849161 [Dendrothele bispora CBS 962.96]
MTHWYVVRTTRPWSISTGSAVGSNVEPDLHIIVKVGVALADLFHAMEGTDFVEELDDYNEEQERVLAGLFEEIEKYERDFEVLSVIIIEEHDVETLLNEANGLFFYVWSY